MKKQFLVVTVPVANLRKEPVEASLEYVCDDLQETQLLCNEYLLYKDETEDWYYVEAVEQKKATSQGDWQGYPGWIQKTSVIFIDTWPELNAVVNRAQAIILKTPLKKAESLFTISAGTRLAIKNGGNDNYHKTTLPDGQEGWIKKDDVNTANQVMDIKRLRSNIVETAKMFLGTPYLWGGRSGCMQNRVQGLPSGALAGGSGFRAQRAEHGVQADESRGILRHPSATTLEGRSGRGQAREASASNLSPLTFHPAPPTAEGTVRGVDCSSLINLAYRVNWLDIPRDAHDQWNVSTEIVYATIQPADLIFVSAEEDHHKITHVMMYLTGEEFIEALETGSVVTINSFKNKFGVTLHEAARQGFIVNKRKICFGSILTAGEKK